MQRYVAGLRALLQPNAQLAPSSLLLSKPFTTCQSPILKVHPPSLPQRAYTSNPLKTSSSTTSLQQRSPRSSLLNLMSSQRRTFSSTPARFCLPRSVRSRCAPRPPPYDWSQGMRPGARESSTSEQIRWENLRDQEHHCPKLKTFETRMRRRILHFFRSRFRSHRRNPHWRPFNGYFRTPNHSGIFTRPRDVFHHEEQCNRLPLTFLDERRRHRPRRTAHIRHCRKVVQEEVAMHFGRRGHGSMSHLSNDDLQFHHRWCLKRMWRERFPTEAGSNSRSHSHQHHHHSEGRTYQHPRNERDSARDRFDYSTFRKAYWYSKTRSRSRPYNSSRTWTGKRVDRDWTKPAGWALKVDRKRRKAAGLTFFVADHCPDVKKVQGVEGRGGNGGIRQYRNRLALETARIDIRPPPTLLLKSASSLFHLSSRPLLSTIPSPTVTSSTPSRAFSSTRRRSGIHFLLPLATALKSSEALHVLVWVTRLSLTLLPLSLRSKAIFALRQRYLRDPASLTASIFSRIASSVYSGKLAQPSSFLSRWNALFGLPFLVIAPVFLLVLVFVSSLERTPVTGRWRLVMLSPNEETELVDSILSVGRTVQSATTSHVHQDSNSPSSSTDDGETFIAPEGTSLDWVAILRQVLQLPDEGVDPDTGRRMLLGGVVLDQRDWRVRWTEAVLRAVEKGVFEGLTKEGQGAKGEGQALRPPPIEYPLEGRAITGTKEAGWKEEWIVSKHLESNAVESRDQDSTSLKIEYDLLVIDRDENNAFSFGFGPERDQLDRNGNKVGGRRGVIVVYTGFLKEVLGDAALPSQQPLRSSPSSSPPNRFTSFFSRSSSASPILPGSDPIASYLEPSILPTQDQCKAVAILLAHECSHLVLSHTLESYASMNLLMPHLSRLTSDVLRTLLYPITAILGPFINDAVGRTLSEGAKGGFGIFGNAANSCESRKLESEADLVALRLLAGSGIDPRFALKFWEDRLAINRSHDSNRSSVPSTTTPFSSRANPIHHHSTDDSNSTGILDGYLNSHPVDEERIQKIRQELQRWEQWNVDHGFAVTA